MSDPAPKMALLASNAASAQEAEKLLRARYSFVEVEEADLIVALGGDGYLLHILRERLSLGEVCPVFGMNRGTVGFLMNEWRIDGLIERIGRAKRFTVKPLEMTVVTDDGETISHHAINEVSLLRETRAVRLSSSTPRERRMSAVSSSGAPPPCTGKERSLLSARRRGSRSR